MASWNAIVSDALAQIYVLGKGFSPICVFWQRDRCHEVSLEWMIERDHYALHTVYFV